MITTDRKGNQIIVCDNCMREKELKTYDNKQLCQACATSHGYIKTTIKKDQNTKIVITAKPHICTQCKKGIAKGTKAIAVQCRSEEYGLYREYYHLSCKELI